MTTLKQVLSFFEETHQPIFLPQLAQQMNISETMLEDMLQFWVRKGKLREAVNPCQACGICPTVQPTARRYELCTKAEVAEVVCNCGCKK